MNETLMILSSDNKSKLLLGKRTLENVKYMSFKELRDKLLFSYDIKALYEVMKRENLSVSNAKIILDNLYFLDDISIEKIQYLRNIYSYLDLEGLIIKNKLAINKIRSSDLVLYGRDFIDSEEAKLLGDVNYSFLNVQEYDRKISVYECNTLEEEIRNLAKMIVNLVRDGVSFDKIKIINLDDEYRMYIERIFPRYNINFNIGVDISLYSLPLTKLVINSDDLFSGLKELEISVKSEEEKEIFNSIIKVFNKYVSLPKDLIFRDIIIEELKNTSLPRKDSKNAVSEGNIDSIYQEDEYLFIVNFNQGIMPRIYKDEDYISDKVKNMLGRVTSLEKTLNEKKKLYYFLNHNKNIVISYKKKSLKETFYPSAFLEEIEIEKMNYINNYDSSNIDNKIILSRGLDNYFKFGEINDDVKKLYNSYRDISYKNYNNKFSGFSENIISDINEKIVLSSTSLDVFKRCSFRYYLSYILKVDRYEESFMRMVGNLIHFVLSKYSSEGFNLKEEWDSYIISNNIGKDEREKFFLNKLYSETEFIIDEIKRQKSYSALSDEYYERKFSINPTNQSNVEFVGFIDKILLNKEEKLLSIIDYKTGGVSLDLSLLDYGIGLQLPVYLYLISKSEEFKDYKVLGFYLQRIINSSVSRVEGKTYLEQKSKNLYLQGYSLGEEDLLSKMDFSYEDSKVIKSLKKNSKGFSRYSKLLSKEEINNIINKVSNTIESSIDEISKGEFNINPKRIGLDMEGCKFCDFKDLCFYTENDVVRYDKVDNKEGDMNAQVD